MSERTNLPLNPTSRYIFIQDMAIFWMQISYEIWLKTFFFICLAGTLAKSLDPGSYKYLDCIVQVFQDLKNKPSKQYYTGAWQRIA